MVSCIWGTGETAMVHQVLWLTSHRPIGDAIGHSVAPSVVPIPRDLPSLIRLRVDDLHSLWWPVFPLHHLNSLNLSFVLPARSSPPMLFHLSLLIHLQAFSLIQEPWHVCLLLDLMTALVFVAKTVDVGKEVVMGRCFFFLALIGCLTKLTSSSFLLCLYPKQN